MSGGGGTTISRTEPPEYVQPYSIEMLERAGMLSNAPYQAYYGQRISPLNQYHQGGLDLILDRINKGSPYMDETLAQAHSTNQGGFLGKGPGYSENWYTNVTNSRPYEIFESNAAQSGVAPEAEAFTANGQTATAVGNALLGLNNPALNQAIQSAQADVTENYQDTIIPELDRQARMSGAFGNSGVQQMQQKSQADLMESLGQISNDMRYKDYGLQAQLSESDAARRSQMNQFNAEALNQIGMYNAGALGDTSRFNVGNQLENMQFNAGLAQQSEMANADRAYNTWLAKMSAKEAEQERKGGFYQAERENMMRAMSMMPQLADYGYTEADRMLRVGDIVRQQDQLERDYAYQQWQEAQQWPYRQLDVLNNAIRTSMGGGGSSTVSAPGSNQLASMIGGGLMGYGVGQEFDSPYAGAIGGGLMGLWGG